MCIWFFINFFFELLFREFWNFLIFVGVFSLLLEGNRFLIVFKLMFIVEIRWFFIVVIFCCCLLSLEIIK